MDALLRDAKQREKKQVRLLEKRGKVLGDADDREVYVYLVVTFTEAPFKSKLRPYAM